MNSVNPLLSRGPLVRAHRRRVELQAGEPVELSHEGLVLLAAGAAENSQGQSWTAMKAPALLAMAGPTRLSSAKGAVAARLPTLEAFGSAAAG